MAGHDRRSFLVEVGGGLLAGLSVPLSVRATGLLWSPSAGATRESRSEPDTVEISMRSDARGAKVWFDPIGVLVRPGQTIRWTLVESVHSTTAYHPRNDRHARRIPAGAEPWDSGILTQSGATFAVTLAIPGVYDYYCKPHEQGGMVGRIVVHPPEGGDLPKANFQDPESRGWKPVPPIAWDAFPPVARILEEGVVRV